DAIFSPHVVRRLHLVAEWRPAQDELGLAQAHEVGQVGVSVWELLDREGPVSVRQVPFQVGFQLVEGQRFPRPNRGGCIRLWFHVHPSATSGYPTQHFHTGRSSSPDPPIPCFSTERSGSSSTSRRSSSQALKN